MFIYFTNLNISPSPQPFSLSLSGNLHWLHGSVVHWKLLHGVLQTFVCTVSPHGLPPFAAFRSIYLTTYYLYYWKGQNRDKIIYGSITVMRPWSTQLTTNTPFVPIRHLAINRTRYQTWFFFDSCTTTTQPVQKEFLSNTIIISYIRYTRI